VDQERLEHEPSAIGKIDPSTCLRRKTPQKTAASEASGRWLRKIPGLMLGLRAQTCNAMDLKIGSAETSWTWVDGATESMNGPERTGMETGWVGVGIDW